MAKCLIMGVAGAGKTWRICQALDPEKKNLLLAFTRENIKNLIRGLKDTYGKCPACTDVMTFHSFVHRLAIRPYLPSILKCFSDARRPTGVTTRSPPPQWVHLPAQNSHPNFGYRGRTQWRHYVDSKNRLYCDRLCELAMFAKSDGGPLIDRIASNINRCYDHVAIDEFQDFRKQEFEVLLGLGRGVDSLLLVGDYYQHSVAGRRNSGKPFDIKGTVVQYDEFVAAMQKNGFDVDTTSLAQSRRCSPEICKFVSRKLGIPIESAGISTGHVRLVPDREVECVLYNPDIVKLVEKKAGAQEFSPCLNWSYSKGDTYKHACVILTGEASAIVADSFSKTELKPVERNKLYVALTRTKGDLFLVTKEQFDRWKSRKAAGGAGQLELELW